MVLITGGTLDTTPPYQSTPGDDIFKGQQAITGVCFHPCTVYKWCVFFPIIECYKGSAWVPAFAGTHAPGRAGQHFDVFDSILDRE